MAKALYKPFSILSALKSGVNIQAGMLFYNTT